MCPDPTAPPRAPAKDVCGMNISYSRPLELGWRRMKRRLFQPFDPTVWLALGFTAWLAQLGSSGNGGSGGSGYRLEQRLDVEDLGAAGSSAWDSLAGFATSTLGMVLLTLLVMGFIVIVLAVMWVSSRGRFLFLDNLVQSRTEVARPWREYRSEGDSLFLWRIGYAVVVFLFAVAIMGSLVVLMLPVWNIPGGVRLLAAVCLGITGFLVVTTAAYVEYFLHHFVVPIMYKHRLGTTAAWGVFLRTFRAQPAAFALFGLLYLAILAAMGIAYLVGGLLTCCVGLVLLVVPYLGTVISLPIPVLGQFMSLEFLAQFGDDLALLPPLPDPDSVQFDADRAVVRTEDLGEDAGRDEPGTQGP